ncbi:MAG: amidohydrolase family protein [Gammaproteobacteria bacterium]|nr:amidohydrolase family protein [Gammaproteobacteria bacterium]NIR84614.1 amidohydrolase family protein [Gammaproteobacteria bacterium]NIR90517.1 amidohydrolase family protein [Gammaproteobacteria bacterium]NIU05665.1 amidohydrolase family protein [Gammaproteobacteria bacterium]NIV52804.1 amidohydrolase family protein [Gammaproteobacteria bacterium]
MGIWLSRSDLARLRPAETLAVRSPVPTRVVSNGEYLPAPQTRQQRRVEAEVRRLAERYARRLRMDRRRFLSTSAGMAAAFMAMNSVYGPLFGVAEAEAAEPGAAEERLIALARQFVFDVQLHFVRDDYSFEPLLGLRDYAKRLNPDLRGEKVDFDAFKFDNFVKEVYLDSDTHVGLLSGAPSDKPEHWFLTNDQMARARAVVNAIAQSRRLLCHAVFTPGQPGWLDELDRVIETLKPDSWKGYTVGDPLGPSRWPWRLDDEALVYPAYARMVKAGIRNVCIHKGLLPEDYRTSFSSTWRYAQVGDVGPAARDWPELNFVIYHSAIKPLLQLPEEHLMQFERTGRIDWVTDLAEIPSKFGVDNVYAELGTCFGSAAVTHPRHAAALLGTLVKGMGDDHILWGTDSVWYGSPQWQIEALRRIEIPEDMQRTHGFAPLGPADGPVKSAILGRNAAGLYDMDAAAHTRAAAADRLAQAKAEYQAEGGARSNLAYGYVARDP